MKKIFFTISVLFISCSALFPIELISIEDSNLLRLLEAQQQNNQAWAANENFLETGNLQYDISKSELFPQVDANLEGSGYNSFLTLTPSEPVDLEINNNYTISCTPEINLSQLLPTSGILTGSVSDTITGSGLEKSNSPVMPEYEIELSNTIDFAIGVSQPLFFGPAYKASLTRINESRDINYINYLDNRNALIYSAVNDYYALIQAAYQKDLVEKRLETNIQYENRMIRENQLGMWTKGHLNTAKAVRLQSEADLLKAEQAVDSAKKSIFVLYGIELVFDKMTSEISFFNLNSAGFNNLSIELLKSNPEIVKNLKNVLIAESEIVLQKKAASPTLTAGGSYSLTTSFEDNAYSDSLGFSLSISMPVLDGKSAAKTIELKQKEVEQLKNNQENQQKQIIFQLQNLLDNINLNKKLSEIYSLQEEAAVFDFEKGIKELELGGITQKELLELQISLENTRLKILLNKIEYNLTVLSIYRLLGTDLTLITGTRSGGN